MRSDGFAASTPRTVQPSDAAGDKRSDNRCRRRGDRAVTAARQPVDIEPLRRGFVGERAVTRADQFGLFAPGADFGRIVRMRRQPGFDGHAAIGGQFAVDIGVKFVLADNLVSIDHRSLSL